MKGRTQQTLMYITRIGYWMGVIYQEQSQKEDELVMLRNGYG